MSDWELSPYARATLRDYVKERKRAARKALFSRFLKWIGWK